MRKILFFVPITVFLLAGCLDSQEDVRINADGSGTYKSTMDMSGLFDMMQMAAMMDTAANSEMKKLAGKNLDSTFSLSGFTDTATALSAEEKNLLKAGTMNLNINQQEKIFRITMNYPFRKVDDLQKLLALQKSSKGFNPFGQVADGANIGGMEGGSFPSPDQMLDIVYKDGMIERKMDKPKMDEMMKDEKMADLKNAGEMLSSVTFGTVIQLPRPAKNVKGEKITLSDDKKTVRVKYTLQDLFSSPEKLEFRVEY